MVSSISPKIEWAVNTTFKIRSHNWPAVYWLSFQSQILGIWKNSQAFCVIKFEECDWSLQFEGDRATTTLAAKQHNARMAMLNERSSKWTSFDVCHSVNFKAKRNCLSKYCRWMCVCVTHSSVPVIVVEQWKGRTNNENNKNSHNADMTRYELEQHSHTLNYYLQ